MERNQIFISLKTLASKVPTVLSLGNGDTITNSYDFADTFNNYSASIAVTIGAKYLRLFKW